MDILPYEIIFKIALNLSYDDIKSYSLINKTYIKLVKDKYFWQLKTKQELNIGSEEFNNTYLPPSKRYLQISSLYYCTYGSEEFVPSEYCLYNAVEQGNDKLIEFYLSHNITYKPELALIRAVISDSLYWIDYFFTRNIYTIYRSCALWIAKTRHKLSVLNYLLLNTTQDEQNYAFNVLGIIEYQTDKQKLEVVKRQIIKSLNKIISSQTYKKYSFFYSNEANFGVEFPIIIEAKSIEHAFLKLYQLYKRYVRMVQGEPYDLILLILDNISLDDKSIDDIIGKMLQECPFKLVGRL